MELNAAMGNAAKCLLSLNARIVGTGFRQDELGQFTEFDIQYGRRKFTLYGYETKDFLEFVVHCRLSFAFSGWVTDDQIDHHVGSFETENLDESEQRRQIRQQLAAKRVTELGNEHEEMFETLQDELSARPSRTTYHTVEFSGEDKLDGVTLRRRIYPDENDFEVSEFGNVLDEFYNDYSRAETILTGISVFDEHGEDQESIGMEPDDGAASEEGKFPGVQ